jgi:hypothetical protein
MNWIARLENRKSLVLGGILLISFSTLLVSSLRGPVAGDSFWHLQMGRDWIENGLSPWLDHYSFTFNGQAISSPPVLFQALLHIAVSHLGVNSGFLAFKTVCFVLILSCTLVLLRQIKASTIIYALALPMVVFLLQQRAFVRPELINYIFTLLALMLYFRAGDEISGRNVWPMALLIWAWTNYHISIVGYVIFCGYFIDCACAQFKAGASARAWAKWLGWGLLVLGVGFLNRDFTHPVIGAITMSSDWMDMIAEYRSPVRLKNQAAIYVLIVIALLVPVLAYRRRKFGYLLVWAVMAYVAAAMIRMVSISGIVITLLAMNLLVAEKFPFGLNRAGRKAVNAAGWCSLALITATLYSNVGLARQFMKENYLTITRFPQALTEYMLAQELKGPVLNHYDIGGYLIYRLSGQNQVYIDGRTGILYPVEHMKTFRGLMNSPEKLRAELDKYQLKLMVWKNDQHSLDVVHDMGGAGLEFMGAQYALFVRGPANFSLLGQLMSQPACWRSDMLQDMSRERKNMVRILPFYSPLVPFGNFIADYSNATDGRAFFDASIEQEEWTDEMRRFAGFRFLEQGEFEIAINLFGGIEKRKPQDYLAAAMAMLSQDRPEAGQVLAEMSALSWPYFSAADRYVQYQLYLSLAKLRALSPEERVFIDSLRELLPPVVGLDDAVEFIPGMLCSLDLH